MTHRKLRSIFDALVLVVIVALVAVTTASPYAGVYFDMGNGGGGTSTVQAGGWADLMGVLEACAAGSDCAVTVASGGETFHWTAVGPLLALADADVVPCEAAAPAQAVGGTFVPDAVPGAPAYKLMP